MSKEAKKQAEGNIQTFLRIRPSKKPSGYFHEDDMNPGTLKITLPESVRHDFVNNSKLHHAYHFNGIVGMEATQEEVFKLVGAPAVQNALDGYNSTVFAYGQTGSGKTFTITGGTERYVDRGIIPRSISMIFNEYRTKSGVEFKAYISYLELYNEQGYDLLDESQETKALEDLPKVVMLEDEHGNFHLKNLSLHPAATEEEALNLLFMGDTNRAVAETPMNLASSRSHCIFTIAMEVRDTGQDRIRRSKLHLVDLAGSERVAKTNSSGSVLSEAKYINTSLFFLEMVIVALYEKASKGRAHVPYRNSMMTSVLRDSLGGNCKTIMIATINPEASHSEESLSTCKFAQRVSLIKNRATINEGMDPDLVIKRLKNEVLTLREEIAFLKGESGEGDVLSPQEAEDLKERCVVYVDNPDPLCMLNLGTMTLTKIKDAFAIFKNMVLEARHAASKGQGLIMDGMSGESQSQSDEELLKQVKDLKSSLLQRDNEIAILVNMVKKGKKASNGKIDNDEEEMQQQQRQLQVEAEEQAQMTRAANQETKSSQKQARRGPQIVSDEERAALRGEKIIKKHLFGVPPPEDKAIFDDMSACFEYFRNNCDLRDAIEENKELLKEKMKQAQAAGEKVNQSQKTIVYLKNSIESIRREKALTGLSDTNATDEESSISPEEATHRRAIEQEKSVYRESFEKLRVLKPEIEHIRKILENSRRTLQSQYDQWYNNLHARDGKLSCYQTRSVGNSQQPNRKMQQSSSDSKYSNDSVSLDEKASRSVSAESKHITSNRQQEEKRRSSPREENQKRAAAAPSKSDLNDSDDDEVNEDIMAFYKAKEELLKRRSNSNT